MGMLIDGMWDASSDLSMRNGTYRRETSAMPTRLDADMLGSVRLIRTGLCKDNMTALYAVPSWRNSARAVAQLSLNFSRA